MGHRDALTSGVSGSLLIAERHPVAHALHRPAHHTRPDDHAAQHSEDPRVHTRTPHHHRLHRRCQRGHTAAVHRCRLRGDDGVSGTTPLLPRSRCEGDRDGRRPSAGPGPTAGQVPPCCGVCCGRAASAAGCGRRSRRRQPPVLSREGQMGPHRGPPRATVQLGRGCGSVATARVGSGRRPIPDASGPAADDKGRRRPRCVGLDRGGRQWDAAHPLLLPASAARQSVPGAAH
mmetsp:Transcript_29609/g.85767  ORF Transcript_29609/g.85767 Transcript_29609/m.85767 type:complete len:232 (+) Transcript_29609:393-1088(+)